jgi:tellurite methyltransferase
MDRQMNRDYEAVRQAVLDYVEGVYETDTSKIERSVHPALAKRGFFMQGNEATESIMTFAEFIEHTKIYNKDGQFSPDALKEITIYEVLDHTASAKLIAAWGIDYMHLAKYGDKWMIVHVLWQTHPQNETDMTDSFDRVYGKPDDPFYYGLKPSGELEKFLKDTHPSVGQALDLGCGEGRNSLLLARYGYRVQAIDASSQGIQKLEKYARSQGLDNIEYTVADARKLQLAPSFYDLIVAVTLLDHLTREEGKKVAESIIHALKPGGSVFIEVMTTHDPGAKTSRGEDENMSETISFIKHFFDDGELARWFSELETLSYEEIMKYDDSHGEPHYHGLARLIGRKKQ